MLSSRPPTLPPGRAGAGRSVRRERGAPPGRPRRDRQRVWPRRASVRRASHFATRARCGPRGLHSGRNARVMMTTLWVGGRGRSPPQVFFFFWLDNIYFAIHGPRPSEGGGRPGAPCRRRCGCCAARGSVLVGVWGLLCPCVSSPGWLGSSWFLVGFGFFLVFGWSFRSVGVACVWWRRRREIRSLSFFSRGDDGGQRASRCVRVRGSSRSPTEEGGYTEPAPSRGRSQLLSLPAQELRGTTG